MRGAAHALLPPRVPMLSRSLACPRAHAATAPSSLQVRLPQHGAAGVQAAHLYQQASGLRRQLRTAAWPACTASQHQAQSG